MMAWLLKWHPHDHQEKGNLRKKHDVLMVDMLNLRAPIGIGGIYEGGED